MNNEILKQALECVVNSTEFKIGNPAYEQCESQLRAAIDAEQADGQEPVEVPQGYPCEIEEADFEANTITVKMLTNDYRIHAGEYRLSASPSPAPVGIKKEND